MAEPPRVVRQQQFEAAYVFGAVCPTEGKAATLVMPMANAEAMQHLLFYRHRRRARETGRIGGGWGGLACGRKAREAPNISILPLPPYSSELNPVEQIWEQLRQSDWANRCFANYDQIVEVCCQAWW